MKISRVDIWPVSIPFSTPFKVWRGVASCKDHVIVEIHTDSGISGIGEASPFLYYAAETQEDVVATLVNHLAPMVIGTNPTELEHINQMFDTVVDGHSFSKTAIETALWDIFGQVSQQPVYSLLGGLVNQTVPVVALLDHSEPDSMAEQAKYAVEEGFSHIKVKIGFEFYSDIKLVELIRSCIPDEVTLRVDAEEGYDLKGALQIAKHLEDMNIELLSQPISRHYHQQMADLRAQTSIRIVVDESIESPHDVALCAHYRSGDVVNIKIMKAGGLLKSKRMAAVAHAFGLDCFVGSMIEMGPGSVAGAHFAVSTPNITYASELVGSKLLSDDILVNDVKISDGKLSISDDPGFGISLDREKLAKYSTGLIRVDG